VEISSVEGQLVSVPPQSVRRRKRLNDRAEGKSARRASLNWWSTSLSETWMPREAGLRLVGMRRPAPRAKEVNKA